MFVNEMRYIFVTKCFETFSSRVFGLEIQTFIQCLLCALQC